MQFREIVYEEIESTNLVVKRAIEEGETEGLVVRAWRQTAAYGRQGRTWASPEGGLYFSVLLRPDVPVAQLPSLSLVAGLAVRDALASFVTSNQARRIKVKWPNDLVVEEDVLAGQGGVGSTASVVGLAKRRPVGVSSVADQLVGPCQESVSSMVGKLAGSCQAGVSPVIGKLAGISLEMHCGALCLGVGVNVEPPLSPVEIAGKNRAAYLAELGHGFVCDRRSGIEDAARVVQVELAKAYERWQRDGFASFVAEYDCWSYLRGRAVEIANIDGSMVARGVVRGIDEQGCLLLEKEDGSLRAVSSGEAHVKGLA